MANPAIVDTAYPPASGRRAPSRHTVSVEQVGAQLRRQTPITGSPAWAVVERYEGRLVKVCATGSALPALTTSARSFAAAYGATFIGLRLPAFSIEPTHPARGVFGESAECVYDPELHTGPTTPETGPEQLAREMVAREVCAPCPFKAVCLAYALAALPTSGIWAALTAPELDQLADAPAPVPVPVLVAEVA
ncbi:WhiB family transcriptional regulator [Streptosporangium sp. NPDC002721]|uniref:WhiB family transcriptional regulator n=1 Tax=Streptosporangium sp. NPDC002721 TaxID=3366188 RepID=UPI00369BD454